MRDLRWVDVVLAGVLFWASGVLDGWAAIAFSAAQILPLAARRWAPGTVLAVVTAATVVHIVLGATRNIGYVPMLIALFTAPSSPHPEVRTWLCAGSAVAVGVAMSTTKGPVEGALLALVIAAVAWTLGVERQKYLTERLELRAALRRERTARRLHDTLGQTTTVMLVQAEALRAGTLGDTERQRVDAILAAGRQAMTEVRRTLSELRDDTPPNETTDLKALLDTVKAAGLTITGNPGPTLRKLPRQARTLAERVIAEATTNVLRHAGPQAHAHIEVRVTAEHVRVRISSTPSGPHAPHGFGLTSLNRQVEAHGGTFTAGVAGRHWRVQAHFPWNDNNEDTVTNR
ncbi:histidine kinase [Actinocrispum sp. NPDC049592]|uniref:sensor histidine kinase n=1 Tax=Actinocrispum sp. NPDC049592 TaxID=3154835 RepID=UPI0034218999